VVDGGVEPVRAAAIDGDGEPATGADSEHAVLAPRDMVTSVLPEPEAAAVPQDVSLDVPLDVPLDDPPPPPNLRITADE
jgi:hypothetical protein